MKKITEKKTAFVAKLIADQVMPGKKYNYEIFINDIKVFRDYEMEFQTQQLWKWRTDPLILNLSLEVVVMLMNRNLIDQANLTEVILKYLIQSIKKSRFYALVGR